MSSLDRVNALLPSELRIDPAYVAAFAAKGFSDELLEHVILDRIESRLCTLDRVRTWGSSPTPPDPRASLVVHPPHRFAEGGWPADPGVEGLVGRQTLCLGRWRFVRLRAAVRAVPRYG